MQSEPKFYYGVRKIKISYTRGMPPQNTPQRGGWGPTIGITLVVVVLAAGGAYFFYTQYNEIQKNRVQAQLETVQEPLQIATTTATITATTTDESAL